MTTNEGPAPSPGTGPSKTHTAAKLVRIDDQSNDVELPGPGTTEPTAEVLEVKPYRHTRGLRVRCPFCGKLHLHGHGWIPDEPVEARVTYRVAHCGSGEYAIIVPAWAAELVRPGSKRRDGASA